MAVEHLRLLLEGLAAAPACLVRVESTQGSVPREPGAWMAVFADGFVGTIGGGHLEHQAMAEARRRLAGVPSPPGDGPMRFALGPALGQCCGGVVHLAFELLTAGDAPTLAERLAPRLHPVALFGGGHVGHALARVLAPLPFALTWIDSRDGIFPQPAPDGVACEHSDPVQMAVPGLAPGTRVLIMSFSHAEDLDVVAACLRRQRERQDLPFIGLIGSKTKWATFSNRLHGRGFAPEELAQVTCPIGVPGIGGKEPEVIAVAVAAQLLQTLG
ncbi:xanthine dehydrogenase [Acidovorax sp. Leaf76]|uniref:xanthine dehydrogenase accessory protein XdhC n=1 Tax=unclassified Acidovorax TaxID=2684926 RepID=UPI0006F8161F|nr:MULTISPECIES: xanthine dehydrogenase accessory protein XdhC [unclassified Acidovorax]KQO22130.1 xanthine dehydrogenase [Acidovorax sp. Leaf76]KQO27462.1 xanthine dehydrogenase [Acidovorax sp. Leaf78]KQO35200.1 xanthine dehydrogenase [Acidovorax sp. Leaf84]KQS34982.1 xanthine dehydrogenase [Acidovorax sp. Leaf191]